MFLKSKVSAKSFSQYASCFLALLIWWGASSPSEARELMSDSWSDVQAAGSGQITVYSIDPNNYEAGILRAFLADLETRYGVDVTAQWVDTDYNFTRTYNAVKEGSGGVFGLSHVSILDRRRKEVAFSRPILNNAMVLIGNTETPAVSDARELSNLFRDHDLVVAERSLNFIDNEIVDQLKSVVTGELRILEMNNRDDMLALVQHDPRYLTYDDLIDVVRAQAGGLELTQHPAGQMGGDLQAIILPLGSDWKAVLDQFLADFIGSAAHRTLLQNDFGDGLGCGLN